MSDIFEQAQNGDKKAQCSVALMFELGLSGEQDFKKAFTWWKKAADQGDGWALSKVAEYYAKGMGVDKNEEQSRVSSEKALDLGFSGGRESLRIFRKLKTARQQKCVLAITADPEIQNSVASYLGEAGYHITTAATSLDATTFAQKNPATQVILTDLEMPGASGFNFISTLKAVKFYGRPCFIMVAKKVTADDVKGGLRVGIDGWLIKPFKKHVVTRIVDKFAIPDALAVKA